MQPVQDPPLGQRNDGVGLAPRVVLQRPERVYCNTARARGASRYQRRIAWSHGRIRPVGENDDGRTAETRGAGRLTEALVLLLEGHDARREQTAEAEAVSLRQGERRVLRQRNRS